MGRANGRMGEWANGRTGDLSRSPTLPLSRSLHRRHLRRRYALRSTHQDSRRCAHRALEPRHAPRRHPAAAPALGRVLHESARGGDRRDARLSWRLRVARRQRPAPPAPHLPLLRERAAVLPGVCDHRQSRCGRRAHGGSAGDGDRPGARRRAAGREGDRVLQPAPARSGAGHSTQQHSGGQRPGRAFPGPRRADHRLRSDAARHGVGADRTARRG